MLIITWLVFVSVWRCYYLPPTSRDALSGPEAIAEYAVREHTLINSFFTVDLWSTNNQFKSPFLISLQLIYKLAGFPFGQIWLSIIFISFTVFLYQALKKKLHPLIAGLLLLLFVMTPEMYAYSFMILYDYSNMVFFFLGLYFLFEFSLGGVKGAAGSVAGTVNSVAETVGGIGWPGLLFGIATYIRSETVLLILPLLPVLWLKMRGNASLKKIALDSLIFLAPSVIAWYLTTELYINHYLPVHYPIGGLINTHLSEGHLLFQRYEDIITRLLFCTLGTHLWGYIFYLATFLFLAQLLFVRRFSREALHWLYAMITFYVLIGALGFVLPMFNLYETTKRALFKLMPMALFYLANNEILLRLSRRISQWEEGPARAKPVRARPKR